MRVHISWNLADRKSAKSCVIYLTKNKISASSPALASARIAPKICQGQLQTIYSEFPKCHPNPFTSCEVIAERVNIVETRDKVLPILDEASSPSKNCTASAVWKTGHFTLTREGMIWSREWKKPTSKQLAAPRTSNTYHNLLRKVVTMSITTTTHCPSAET